MLNQQKPLHAFLDSKIQLIIFVFQNLILCVNMKTTIFKLTLGIRDVVKLS